MYVCTYMCMCLSLSAPIPDGEDYIFNIYVDKPLEMELAVGGDFLNPKLEVFTTLGLITSQFLSVSLGQLLSHKALTEGTALSCTAPAFVFLSVTDLLLLDSAAELGGLRIEGVLDSGLDNLLEKATEIGNQLMKG